jgi:hypothetical protein
MDEKESKALSINAERSDISLESEAPDKAATTLKGLLGIIPGVGSVLQEAVGVVIPNQRIDRVVRTMKILKLPKRTVARSAATLSIAME